MTGIMLSLLGARTVAPPIEAGSQLFTNPATVSWVVPTGVTSVSIVCVGGGGGACRTSTSFVGGSGAGGGLAYANGFSVTPGETLTVTVGSGGLGSSSISDPGVTGGTSSVFRGGTLMLRAFGGEGGTTSTSIDALGGSGEVNTGLSVSSSAVNTGGNGYRGTANSSPAGGGGAAGFSGNGGRGSITSPTAGSGGGGGGGYGGTSTEFGGGGGGVGVVNGEGTSGAAGTSGSGRAGKAGSGGVDGSNGVFNGIGGAYGGGAGSMGRSLTDTDTSKRKGGNGVVYIVWPGTRSFPSDL